MTIKPKVNINRIKDLIKQGEYIFTDHADQKKFEREITTNQVIGAILDGEIQKRDNDHTPYPRAKILGDIDGKSIVIVVDQGKSRVIIVTVYPV